MPYLRQSTAQTIRFGPFLDATDGVTEETALTITPALRRLSKDGGAFAAASGAVNATHDSDGWYTASLTTTDTNTVGELILNVQVPATHLPVWMRWWVLEEAIYDDLFGASAVGYNKTTPLTAAQVNTECDTALTDYDGPTRTEATSDKDEIITDLDDIKGTGFVKDTHSLIDIETFVDILDDGTSGNAKIATDAAAILVDTGTTLDGRIPTALVGGRMDSDIGAKTGNVPLSAQEKLDVNTEADTAITDAALATAAALAAVDTVVDAIKAVSDLLPNAGALSDLAAILTDTGTTLPAQITALNDLSAANVLTEINTALDTAIAELGVAAPTATPTLRTGLMLLYMALRNKLNVTTSGTDSLDVHNDAGTKIAGKLLTDTAGDYSEAEMA